MYSISQTVLDGLHELMEQSIHANYICKYYKMKRWNGKQSEIGALIKTTKTGANWSFNKIMPLVINLKLSFLFLNNNNNQIIRLLDHPSQSKRFKSNKFVESYKLQIHKNHTIIGEEDKMECFLWKNGTKYLLIKMWKINTINAIELVQVIKANGGPIKY